MQALATIGNTPDKTRQSGCRSVQSVGARPHASSLRRHTVVTEGVCLRTVVLLGLILSACGEDTAPSVPTPTASPSPTPSPSAAAYTPCDAATRVGEFAIELGEGFTALEGRVRDAVIPANVRAVTAESGRCKLLQGRSLFCDPACGASQTCGEAGVCIAFPTAKSVGAVTVSGLSTALTIMPTAVNFYSNGATTIPHPGFAPGAAISVSAAGGQLPAFALAGVGVAELALSTDDIVVARDQPVSLRWTAASTTAAVRLRFVLDLAHHGGIAASIDCDGVPDTGSFEIPATLATALLDIGVAGFPKITATRRSADAATISAGCVELSVLSKAERTVVIPGLESCADDTDCSGGKTCQPDLTCG